MFIFRFRTASCDDITSQTPSHFTEYKEGLTLFFLRRVNLNPSPVNKIIAADCAVGLCPFTNINGTHIDDPVVYILILFTYRVL